jgi:hypothetical protein
MGGISRQNHATPLTNPGVRNQAVEAVSTHSVDGQLGNIYPRGYFENSQLAPVGLRESIYQLVKF